MLLLVFENKQLNTTKRSRTNKAAMISTREFGSRTSQEPARLPARPRCINLNQPSMPAVRSETPISCFPFSSLKSISTSNENAAIGAGHNDIERFSNPSRPNSNLPNAKPSLSGMMRQYRPSRLDNARNRCRQNKERSPRLAISTPRASRLNYMHSNGTVQRNGLNSPPKTWHYSQIDSIAAPPACPYFIIQG